MARIAGWMAFLMKKPFREVRSILRYNKLRIRVRGNKSLIRIIIGAARFGQKGWLATDENFLNLLRPFDWERLFKPNAIDALLAEHVWEHLSRGEGLKAAKICFKYLKKGGYLRVAVPDGFHPESEYVSYVKPGGNDPGCNDHEVLYNYLDFKNLFEKAGFKAELLEYFDENGKFHYQQWEKEDGMIKRSKRFDKRNKNGKLNYTSIILDAVKS